MNDEDRKLLEEHNRLMKYLALDFQKFHETASKLLPEFEKTKTIERMKNEREMFFYRSKKLV